MFARIATTQVELDRCLEIRRTVFIDEQGVEEALELDGLDAVCTHFLAWYDEPHEVDRVVGTARLILDVDGNAKVQRVAVEVSARRLGVGRLLIRTLEAEARNRAAKVVMLGAQLSALPFYEGLGYEAYGDEFDDAGIPHRMMRRPLSS